MIELQNPYDLNFPCYLISTNGRLEEISINKILLNGTLIQANKLYESQRPLTGTVITCIEDLFKVQIKRSHTVFIIDKIKGIFYLCNKAVTFFREYRLIEIAYPDRIKVTGISNPIKHNCQFLKEDGINRINLVAELAVWNDIRYFLDVKNNEHRTKHYKI